MKLTDNELNDLKIKLALQGPGAKIRLASTLKCHNSQLTLILDTGKVPEKYEKKIKKYLGI